MLVAVHFEVEVHRASDELAASDRDVLASSFCRLFIFKNPSQMKSEFPLKLAKILTGTYDVPRNQNMVCVN